MWKKWNPVGCVGFLAGSQENQSGHSETAGLHPSVGEGLVRISGSHPGCSRGKKRSERTVFRRRRHDYHHCPLLQVETPPVKVKKEPAEGNSVPGECRLDSGAQRQETVSIFSSFSQWTLWTWPFHGVPSQTFMHLRVPITHSSFLTPMSKLGTTCVLPNPCTTPQPRPFSCGE